MTPPDFHYCLRKHFSGRKESIGNDDDLDDYDHDHDNDNDEDDEDDGKDENYAAT